MGRRRGGGTGLTWILCIVIAVLLIPREVWIALAVAAVIAGAVYVYLKVRGHQARTMADTQAPTQPYEPTLAELMARSQDGRKVAPAPRQGTTSPPPASPAQVIKPPSSQRLSAPPGNPLLTRPSRVTGGAEDQFYTATVGGGPAIPAASRAVPAAPAGLGQARWVPPGESVDFAGSTLPGGMFYFGALLAGANGRPDPCLISGLPSIAFRGDYRERQMNYWPSYADISPTARRAYINWLSEGRSHPDCDIGFVFLFFYGLERRVIIDTPRDPSAKGDWPAIATELRRLLGIYGGKSASFRRYAGELLDWMELHGPTERLYTRPVPVLPRTYELPRYLRLALGQAAVDREPVPATLALAWLRLNPDTHLRTPATRCPEEFERLFMQRYHEMLGPGLVLPKNRTKLKVVYQPASSSFHGAPAPTLTFGDIPDPTALTKPIRTLTEIAEQCTDELASFSRLVGKDPTARSTLDGLLQLPATLWPPLAQARVVHLVDQMRDGMLTLSLSRLIVQLGGTTQPFNRERIRALARTLAAMQIGMEPDVLAGARTPDTDDPIVLFSLTTSEATQMDSGAYQAAMLTLQLASAVARADGEFSAAEIAHLRREIQNWNHLTSAHQRRLQAHLQWLIASPITLQNVKRRFESIGQESRETVAAFMATLTQIDGIVSPDEVRFLEKVYKALGVETKRVFSDVHATSAGSFEGSKASGRSGFKLDASRIAELQKDTERVASLLADIFSEDEPPAPEPLPEDTTPVSEPCILGLDASHTAFVRLLLSRPHWTRNELEDAAADLDLMLDGALERVNEASFDSFSLPLTDGEDPVEVNAEVIGMIEQ